MNAVKKISEQSAVDFDVTSRLTAPISQFTMLERSLLFAELSTISYMKPDDASVVARRIGFRQGKFFNRDGSQAYLFSNDHDSVVCCRGTEASEWNDIKADVYAMWAFAETVGRVHRGFKQEVDDLWPHLEEALTENTKKLWFTGHSLGGAMATICAGRCVHSDIIDSNPEDIYTFGSPRVGNRRYVNFTKLRHYRWVNNNDIVPRVPPIWMGFRHTGTELYLNRNGDLKEIRGWRRASDRLKGFLRGLYKFRIDQFSDHSMFGYIDSIQRAIEKEKKKQATESTDLK